MCDIAIIESEEVKTCWGLADALGLSVSTLPIAGCYPLEFVPQPDDCLCPIDITEAARLAGRSARQNESLDWVIEQRKEDRSGGSGSAEITGVN